MLTISNPIHARSGDVFDYYASLGQEGYYMSNCEGHWLGSACDALGLKGKVEARDFRKLMAGISPRDGSPLVQNVGAVNRQGANDLAFSCHKEISLRWAFGTIRERKLIKRALRRAVREAFREIEATAGLSRVGKAGRKRELAKLVAAMFIHETSRANEPQLHVHVLLFNVGIRVSDGSTGSLYTKKIFKRKLEFGKYFRTELALSLAQSGFELVRRKGELTLDVDSRLVAAFSSRRKAILTRMKELGVTGAIAAKVAALETRAPKTPLPREKAFRLWRETALSLGWKEHTFEVLPEKSHQQVRQNTVERGVSQAQALAPGKTPSPNSKAKGTFDPLPPGSPAPDLDPGRPRSDRPKAKGRSAGRRVRRPLPKREKSKGRFKKRRQKAFRYLELRRYRPLGKSRIKALSKLCLLYLKPHPSNDAILTEKEKKTLWTIHKRKRQLTLYEWGKSRTLANYVVAAKSLLEDDGKKVVIVGHTGSEASHLGAITNSRSFTPLGLANKAPKPPKNISIEKQPVFPNSPLKSIRKLSVPYVRVGPSQAEFDRNTIFMVTEAHRLHAEQVKQIIKFAAAYQSKVVFLHAPPSQLRDEEMEKEYRLRQMRRHESRQSKDQSQSQQHSH